uniref:non-specific serine/threonine protein kinase n=1 Tax=Amphimedon queenslandica TaxID=400682 RepID=A0A1X7V911_AMPQE
MSEAESGFDDTKGSTIGPSLAPLSFTSRCIKRSYNDSGTVVCAHQKALNDTDHLTLQVPQIEDHFNVLSKLGEGTFSSVYLASVKTDSSVMVALKHIIPTSSTTRIENEIRCLKIMGGKDNVIPIHASLRFQDHTVLILPYFSHDRFIDYLPTLTAEETRQYMHALFLALRNVHMHHIIHRDIKPSNFLYHRASKRFQLIDFGLAHHESSSGNKSETRSKGDSKLNNIHVAAEPLRKRKLSSKRSSRSTDERAVSNSGLLCPTRHSMSEVCGFCLGRNGQVAARAGTPGFRAPEVLLKCSHQTTAVDIWSAGVILLCILSQRYPFFRAQDDQSALAQIISLMGSKECTKAAIACGKEMVCCPDVPAADLKCLCHALRKSNQQTTSRPTKKKRPSSPDPEVDPDSFPSSAFDLLYKCLDVNPKTRLTATLALKHPFFEGVR